jgi:hypothetical protein
MAAFAEFVAGAHSWYKHTPPFPPGFSFQFFLDPSAGTQRVFRTGGKVGVVPREKAGFHYSWIPTAEYRERFGYLAYTLWSPKERAHFFAAPEAPSDDQPCVFHPRRERLVWLPDEVLAAGRSMASGVVHDVIIPGLLLAGVTSDTQWPEESGGRPVLEEILDRCRELKADWRKEERISSENARREAVSELGVGDYPLFKLVGPERSRQRQHMADAMQRAVELI